VRLEGLGQLKNPITSSEIEPATFQLVAYCLNQLRYRVTQLRKRGKINRKQYKEGITERRKGKKITGPELKR
jgi:hypothetical protein